ncbi:helix-turn-helix transcriptional regulator [Salinarimonas soli]|uniref:LuxR family transcriptional regulator n=1 Tax=Salinarimonas soli TaxID=1638099 RepID=A0A5B2V2T8_9HYPH|nr:LuxR family transcriptional regulator [Salinarimonas soli]KAA2233138.1 LuxR family transcriptional regulator [Salinarimonas soli]
MLNIRAQAFELIDRLAELPSEVSLAAELRRAGDLFGFDNFFMTGLPARPDERLEKYAMVSGWPDEWLSRYTDYGYVHVDPVIRKIRATTMPFMWDEAPYDRDDHAAARVMSESPDFGLVVGMTVPIHTVKGFTAGVCFSSRHRLHWNGETRAALHLIAIYAHARAVELIEARTDAPSKPPVRLSAREVECLRWTAAGKTAWEISVILRLSEHTVTGYLQSAAVKLGAVNRIQAVAEAIRHRHII